MALISVNTQTSASSFTHTDMNQIIDALKSASYDVNVAGLQINGTAVTTSASELNFVDGVTSNIQTQLDAKAPLSGAVFTAAIEVATSGAAKIIMDDTDSSGETQLVYQSGNTNKWGLISDGNDLFVYDFDATATRAKWKDDGVMLLSGDLDVSGYDVKDIAVAGLKVYSAGSVGGTTAIDWNLGAAHSLTLSGNTTFTFTAPTVDSSNGLVCR